MEKWKENFEIILIFLGLVATGVLIYLTITYNQESKIQLTTLNSNIIQLLPKEPDIKILASISQNTSNGMEGIIYNCVTWSPFSPPNLTFPEYDIVRFFIKNDGKETTRLKIDFDKCMINTAIFKVCSEIGQDTKFIIKEGPYKIIEIQEMGQINPQVLTLVYAAGKSPSGCMVRYSSEDIVYNETYVNFIKQEK
jgi:hypothetical protein